MFCLFRIFFRKNLSLCNTIDNNWKVLGPRPKSKAPNYKKIIHLNIYQCFITWLCKVFRMPLTITYGFK